MHSFHVFHRLAFRFLTKTNTLTCFKGISNITSPWMGLIFLYPQIHPYHAWKQRDGLTWARFFSCLVRPVKYHLIDVGHSKVYNSSIPLEATLDSPGCQCRRSYDSRVCNSFAVDVYCMDNLIHQEFTKSNGLPSLRYCAKLTL